LNRWLLHPALLLESLVQRFFSKLTSISLILISLKMFDVLPEEILLKIAGYLTAEDALAFSHTDRRAFEVISNAKTLWRKHTAKCAVPSVGRCATESFLHGQVCRTRNLGSLDKYN
jgi:hypothetical protein